MDIKVVPYNINHLENFDYNGIEKGYTIGDFKSVVNNLAKDEQAFVIMINGIPVAFIGGHELNDGVAQLWGVFNIEIKANLRGVIKLMEAVINEKTAKFHRVQTLCFSHNVKARRLIEYLGFKEESILEQFGSNREDYTMFVKLREI